MKNWDWKWLKERFWKTFPKHLSVLESTQGERSVSRLAVSQSQGKPNIQRWDAKIAGVASCSLLVDRTAVDEQPLDI